jgi:2-octaprenyl-6-methoxyphenol hydroxylase
MSGDFDYDVIIAGGGMVGASLALQLSCQSDSALNILVVESFPLPVATNAAPVFRPSFDARSSALSYGSRLILEKLGVWPALSNQLSMINRIHVSERGSFGSATLEGADIGWPELGYVIENAWLGNVLLSALRLRKNIKFCSPANVRSISPRQNGVDVCIDVKDDQQLLRAQLVVVADGADSGLRKQLGIEARVQDYRQTALIANVCFSQPHQGCAYERFTDQGPMALLPLTDSEQRQARSALVWTLADEQATHLSECDEAEFLATLQQRFGHRQGEFIRVGDRFSYPLKLVESEEQVRSGIVVMGNAAHSLHPVAGQGFNLALRDCARLSEVLVSAYRQQQYLGDLLLLQNYRERQRFDQGKTVMFSDRVTALFSNRQLAVSLLRNIGLLGLDITPALKQQFIVHAAGLHDGAAGGAG